MKEELLEIISKEFGNYASTGAGILLIIISISYISAILTSVIDSENNNIVSFACGCLICVPIIQNVLFVVKESESTIESIRNIMISSIPGLCTMSLSSGAGGAITFVTITQIAAILLCEIFLPLSIAYTALGICQSISGRFDLSGIKNMVKLIFNWGLGLMMMVFSCTATLSGALTGAKANLATRSLKYTGAMVPVVGRYLAESADMVFASASVIKGTAGTLAIGTIITTAAAPCIKMALMVITYKIAGILIKPVADEKIVSSVTAIGEAYMMITGITILMSIMCIMNIAVLISISGGG